MKIQRKVNLWNYWLMLIAACVITTPNLAGAAPLAQIPTSPITGYLAAGEATRTPDYYTTANWANSPPLAKFVDTLPGLGSGKSNNLGQYLTVAKPDITTYPGSDYYEINLVEYKERMHSDLPAAGTLLRGYVQVNLGTNISPGTMPSQNLCGADRHACTSADTAPGTGITPDTVHYLGPTIISERDRPVRIKFTNRLPFGPAGDLFIPVDTTVMGAGSGPANQGAKRGEGTDCDNTADGNTCASYTQNRGLIHLHGGRTPWISDGTPHQWITPVEENTPFTKGVSFQNVPDMPDPGDGSMTYYYTNQQSSRLMFYHDHSWGITRLNVYAGGAAGYLITDKYEQDLITRGLIPPDQIPLILQDKTYVDATPVAHPVSGVTTPKIRVTDPLWNWGSSAAVNGVRAPVTGDLWLPHVYMPAQTLAAGFGGVNPFGRWMYGPWFYPATVVTKGPVANPYYDSNCSSANPLELALCETPGQPPLIPGTPNVSMGMEAFQDSAVVNGTAFPSLTVDPRAYRFRILNAASDRFFNLSFYQADPTQISPDSRLQAIGRSNKTEVKMLPASAELASQYNWPALWPVDGREGGVPDPAFKGPDFLQIGTDSGFLPQPVVIEPQPITYNIDPTAFWVGNVDKMGLAVGPAERADVIVDFSAYAGKTLILYNDAPAAWPAGVAGYDYYTGAPDMRESGGYGTGGTFNRVYGVWENGTGPLVGYAPNTRTVMQVIVRPAGSTVDGAYSFNKANLEKEFTSAAPVTAINPAPTKTLFERAQEPIIVGQAAYKDAYPNSYFPTNFPWEGINQINDQFLKFVTIAGEEVVVPTEPKGIHDEMGASFDPVYGRMSGNLGMQLPNPTTLTANLILYGFSDLPTETINNSTQLNVTVIPGTTNLADGTQIWKISHNGVDTHPIHFHIFDVQLINRVGWDGQILLPEPNELGWKDVVKISPLEDTIVAVRPRTPALPFGITNSLRPLNPAIRLGSTMGFNSVDWTTGLARTPVVTNIMYNFGWEYVWHCHILSHEEMDMMRPIVVNYIATIPPAFTAKATSNGGNVDITWNDPTPVIATDYSTFGNSANEVGFNVYRSINGTDFTKVNSTNLLANSTSYTDTSPVAGAVYKVEAFNTAGSTYSPVVALISVSVATTNGPTFTAPATVNLEATITALPTGVTITGVEFYSGTTLIHTSPANPAVPYTFSWTATAGGTYSITAKATDSLGGITVSIPIDVAVTGTIAADFTATGSANGADIGYCETVTFTSTANTNVTGWSWSINGTNPQTQVVNSAPLKTGIYPVTLGVINNVTGETAQVTKNVTIVNHNPTAITGGPYT
ncbi:MAG: multicopper oxidase domain-containing protein, partial [Desulfuromonadaceae bacterium]|nr:multicopper oxidase domain-containing protein [Desulfuromonadaceae bacterium]